MSKRMFNRRKFLALSATVGVAAVSACAAPAAPAEPPKAVEPTSAPAPAAAGSPTGIQFQGSGGLVLPVVKEPIKLNAFSTPLYAPAKDVKTLGEQIYFREAGKRTGVTFDWQMAGEADENPIDLLMASGDLPDLFVGITPLQAVDYGQQGALAPLNDLIEKYCPNFSKALKENPVLKGQLVAPDGNIYFFPRLLLEATTRNFSGFIIRQDWLDKVGMKIPDTTDELYEVLKAFKKEDPNRYPLTFTPTPLIWAFGVGGAGGANNTDFYRVDPQVKYAPTEVAYGEGLDYINKLFKEGLIDPEYLTTITKSELLKERWLKGISGVQFGYAGSHLSAFSTAIKEAQPEARLVAMLSPKGPRGERENLSVHNVIDPGQGASISAKSQNKEALAQFIDYIYSPEGSLLYFWGLEGDTFNFDKEGVPQYTDKVTKNAQKLSVGEWVWNYISPTWFGPMNYLGIAYLQSVTAAAADGLRLWSTGQYKQKLPVLSFTKEETDVIKTKMTDINTLLTEKRAKWINGEESISSLPDFSKQVKDVGLPDVLKVQQAAYDRFLKA